MDSTSSGGTADHVTSEQEIMSPPVRGFHWHGNEPLRGSDGMLATGETGVLLRGSSSATSDWEIQK